MHLGPSPETKISRTVIPVSEGGNICPSTSDSMLETAAATPTRKSQKMNSQDKAQTKTTGEFSSHETTDPKLHDVHLYAPQHINLYKVGLRRSPRIKEKAEQTAKQKKGTLYFRKEIAKTCISLYTALHSERKIFYAGSSNISQRIFHRTSDVKAPRTE